MPSWCLWSAARACDQSQAHRPTLPNPPPCPPQVELLCRVSTLLLRLHMQQLMGTPSVRPLLIELQALLRQRVQELKDLMGYNLAAITHLQRSVRERGGVVEPEVAAKAAQAVLPLKRKAAAR